MNLKNQRQNIIILYHSDIENQAKQLQRKLIVYGQTKWFVNKYDETINYSSNNYENRLNSLMRSTVLICILTEEFFQSEALKKELYIVEKTQKQKKIVLIYYEKVGYNEQYYEKYDLMSNSTFIIDGLTLDENDNEENLKVLINFIRKQQSNNQKEETNLKQLLNERYYFNQIFKDNSSPSQSKRPLTGLLKNAIGPTPSTFKKHFELIQKKYENLLELYSMSYNFDLNMFTLEFVNTQNVLIKFEQIENEIDVLLKNDELNLGYSIGSIRLPNTNSLNLMSLLMNFYYFKQFIIKNLIDTELLVTNQIVYKEQFLERNKNLKHLLEERSAIFDKQIELIKKQIHMYDTELIDSISGKLRELEMDLKKEQVLNFYTDIAEAEKLIESKEATYNSEVTVKERLCKCFRSERAITLEEKLENLKIHKGNIIAAVEKNHSKLQKYFILKNVNDFVEKSKRELDDFEEEKYITDDYLKKLDHVEYGK